MADATVSAAGLKIVKLLVGNPPHTVSDLIEATGVTRTAVTEQLNDLVSLGFVEQGAERLPGRGRPRHIYKATDSAMMLLFAPNQRLLVSAIWQSIADISGDEMKNKVRKRVSRIMAEHYSGKITAKRPEERLRQLMELLNEEGGIMEVAHEGGQVVWYKRSCPFISMIDQEHTICHIDLDMMSQVVGRAVRRTACRYEGDPCCRVEIAK